MKILCNVRYKKKTFLKSKNVQQHTKGQIQNHYNQRINKKVNIIDTLNKLIIHHIIDFLSESDKRTYKSEDLNTLLQCSGTIYRIMSPQIIPCCFYHWSNVRTWKSEHRQLVRKIVFDKNRKIIGGELSDI